MSKTQDERIRNVPDGTRQVCAIRLFLINQRAETFPDLAAFITAAMHACELFTAEINELVSACHRLSDSYAEMHLHHSLLTRNDSKVFTYIFFLVCTEDKLEQYFLQSGPRSGRI